MLPPDHLLNPFGVDPRLELPHPFSEAPQWSEYHYQFAYDPDHNVGVSIHIGRLLEDPGIWRGILYVFPPEGDVLIHRCIGRATPAGRGPAAGPFKSTCLEPMRLWRLEFDGAMHRATEAELANGIARDGIDEVIKFDLLLEAAAPLYSLHKEAAKGTHTWPHHHHEQIHTLRGEFTYRGNLMQLRGMGIRDHSSGARDYTQMLGAHWIQLLFPSGRAAHATVVSRQGSDMSKLYVANRKGGYIWWNDGAPLELVELLDGPPVCTNETPLASLPRNILEDERRNFSVTLGSSRGSQTIQIERIRGTCTTYIPPCEEIAGTDLSRLDSLQQGKNILRASWDGEVGYGMTDHLASIRFLRRV